MLPITLSIIFISIKTARDKISDISIMVEYFCLQNISFRERESQDMCTLFPAAKLAVDRYIANQQAIKHRD